MTDAECSGFKNSMKPYYMDVYHDRVKGLSERDKMSILSTLKRYQKQYPFSSFLYVESTTKKVIGREKIRQVSREGPRKYPLERKRYLMYI